MHALTTPYPSLFSGVTIDRLLLRNRLAVAPMTRTSATESGLVSDPMIPYYASFARGGFALIITEGTYFDEAHSQGYVRQPGIATDEHAAAWRRVTDAVHRAGAHIFIQLMHAGALVQGNRYREDTIAPSAVQPLGEKLTSYGGHGPFILPNAMSAREIEDVIARFGEAARRARAAGFDGVEVHAGNGYLLDQFICDYSNRRSDRYGGSIGQRVRFAAEVLERVREAVGPDFPVGVRLSQNKVNDATYLWPGREQDAAVIFATLAATGVDYLHVTSRDATLPAFGGDADPTLAGLATRYGGVPVIATGKLADPEKAERLIRSGDATMIALAKGALANMDWPHRVEQGRTLAPFTPAALSRLHSL